MKGSKLNAFQERGICYKSKHSLCFPVTLREALLCFVCLTAQMPFIAQLRFEPTGVSCLTESTSLHVASVNHLAI